MELVCSLLSFEDHCDLLDSLQFFVHTIRCARPFAVRCSRCKWLPIGIKEREIGERRLAKRGGSSSWLMVWRSKSWSFTNTKFFHSDCFAAVSPHSHSHATFQIVFLLEWIEPESTKLPGNSYWWHPTSGSWFDRDNSHVPAVDQTLPIRRFSSKTTSNTDWIS